VGSRHRRLVHHCRVPLGPYVPEYLASLEAIEGGHETSRSSFVNEGRPTGQPSHQDWIRRRGTGAVAQQGAGSSGRPKRRLDHARASGSRSGPRDVLDVRYLAAVRGSWVGSVPRQPTSAVVATKACSHGFRDNRVDKPHLGYRYHHGPRWRASLRSRASSTRTTRPSPRDDHRAAELRPTSD